MQFQPGVTAAMGTAGVGASPAAAGAGAGVHPILCPWDEGQSSHRVPLIDGDSYVCFWPWTLVGEVGQMPAAPRDPQMPNVG